MLTFTSLWNNHPTIKGEQPLLSTATYQNQCAVNMHACLERSGVDLKTFQGVRSWGKNKPRYALRAQELANWLTGPFARMPFRATKYSGKEAFDRIDGKRGVIFFQNYWGPGNQGDHIDLWNGSRLTDWRTWARIHMRVGEYGLHDLGAGSDFKKSASVWFWVVS